MCGGGGHLLSAICSGDLPCRPTRSTFLECSGQPPYELVTLLSRSGDLLWVGAFWPGQKDRFNWAVGLIYLAFLGTVERADSLDKFHITSRSRARGKEVQKLTKWSDWCCGQRNGERMRNGAKANSGKLSLTLVFHVPEVGISAQRKVWTRPQWGLQKHRPSTGVQLPRQYVPLLFPAHLSVILSHCAEIILKIEALQCIGRPLVDELQTVPMRMRKPTDIS